MTVEEDAALLRVLDTLVGIHAVSKVIGKVDLLQLLESDDVHHAEEEAPVRGDGAESEGVHSGEQREYESREGVRGGELERKGIGGAVSDSRPRRSFLVQRRQSPFEGGEVVVLVLPEQKVDGREGNELGNRESAFPGPG